MRKMSEVINIACYILNKVLIRQTLNIPPYELWGNDENHHWLFDKKRFPVESWIDESFNKIKSTLWLELVLALPNFKLTFELEYDSCVIRLGAFLIQTRHLVTFTEFGHSTSRIFMRSTKPAKIGSTTYYIANQTN